MIDARALTGPGAIVLDGAAPLEPFRRWVQAAKSAGGQVWLQINHPGRQVYADMPGPSWSPSDVKVDVGKQSKRFAPPTAMTDDEIAETIAMQGRAADERTLAREAYFLELAEQLLAATAIPVMITGGITRLPTAETAIASGVAVVGLGGALAYVPDLPRR